MLTRNSPMMAHVHIVTYAPPPHTHTHAHVRACTRKVWEQKIGTCGSEAEHCPGTALKPSITLVSKATVNGVRTVVLTRALVGISKNHYTFDPSAQATIPFISAVGWSDTFEQHKAHAPAVVSLTNPVGEATCICDKGALAQLCNADGTGCGAFVKNCAAAPEGSLLQQNNPTCNSTQYVTLMIPPLP